MKTTLASRSAIWSQSSFPKKVRIFEVGPRDGLQNESTPLSFAVKKKYIESLIQAGASDIEIGAFVRPDKIPQMAGSDKLFDYFRNEPEQRKSCVFWGLVPNEHGLDRAIAARCDGIAIFTGATDTFTKNNIGMTIAESLSNYKRVIARALAQRMRVRAYISVVWGCPYEGKPTANISKLTRQLLDQGVEQVSLGDTIGVATPLEIISVVERILKHCKPTELAGHFHDTRGTALANTLAALSTGINTIDASSAGLGGCNYAPGASGNLATEDLVYMLNGMRIKHGISLKKLTTASMYVLKHLKKQPASRYLQAIH